MFSSIQEINCENNLQELLKYKERFKIALKVAKICVFEVDLTNQLYTFFENSEDIFGIPGEKILREVEAYSVLSPNEYQLAVSNYFSHKGDMEVIDNAFKNILVGKPATYQARMKAGDTLFVWCKIDVTPIMENGVPVRMIGVITDISDIKAKTDLLEKQSKLDCFLGLYNKQTAIKLIKDTLVNSPHQRHALILIDLDDFKSINDNHGHAAGDEVLKDVADNLKNVFRKNDIIGRFGGDEFVILVKDIDSYEPLCSKLKNLLDSPDNKYDVTKSIGVSIYPEDGTNYNLLFKKADAALYNSKIAKNTYTLSSSLS